MIRTAIHFAPNLGAIRQERLIELFGGKNDAKFFGMMV
jgi:hypothetical protein